MSLEKVQEPDFRSRRLWLAPQGYNRLRHRPRSKQAYYQVAVPH